MLVLIGFAVICRAGEESPVRMAPLEVKEDPFGWIGVVKFHGKTTWLARITKSAKMLSLFFDEIVPSSAADRSGILAGDEVLKVDGTSVREMSIKELLQILSEKEVGATIDFFVLHKGALEPSLVKVKVERSRKKEPNQSLQPTAPSGRG